MQKTQEVRQSVIVRTSVIGILANLFLAGMKAAVGVITHSIAVTLDAVNNLSDALSSVITILGAVLAGKKPDAKHPLGYGRTEYISALAVASIVLYAGLTSLVESVKKLIHPVSVSYSPLSLFLIAAAVVVKLLLGSYVKRKGKEVNSSSLTASGADALSDAILSASVLLSAVLYLLFDLRLEALVGAVISVFIIRSGVEMLTDTLDDILGRRMDREFLQELREFIQQDQDVLGVYDLILHNYGPDRYLGSVHVEIPDTLSAEEIDRMERRIAQQVYMEKGVALTGVGIYVRSVGNDALRSIQEDVSRRVMSREGVLQMHGFHVNPDDKTMQLDVVLDFEIPDRRTVCEEIREELQEAYPDYRIQVTMDIDF